jgi:hypothetical protein
MEMPSSTAARILPLVMVPCLCALESHAQRSEPGRTLQVEPVTGNIRIDGRLDEPDWAQAAVATDFVQNRPQPGMSATQRTEVRVLLGVDAVYVGARLVDHPDSITVQLARRDAVGAHTDWFFVMLDSYNDGRTAFGFGATPRGVKADLLITEDTRRSVSWNAVWSVATHIDSLGWTAEFRIPLSQLRYNPQATVWGLNFQRVVARTGESSLWSPTPPDAAGLVSRFGQLEGLYGLTSPKRLEFEPYSVARVTRAPQGAPGDPFHRRHGLHASAGLDFRYGISSSLTLTGSLNPDFGQVEADPSVVNLTAFEAFFPELRPFFIEGANLFDVDAGPVQLFYSRRIGRQPQGIVPAGASFRSVPEASTILGAIKLSGKTSAGWSVGVLNAVTASEEARFVDAEGVERSLPVEPLTNYGVARVSRDFRGGESAVGVIATSTYRHLDPNAGLGFLRRSSFTGGLDGRHRFGGGNYEVRGSLVGSHIAGSTDAIRLAQRAPGRYFHRPDAEHLRFDPDLTSLTGFAGTAFLGKLGGGRWRWGLTGNAVSPGFEANDIGFQRQADIVEARVYASVNQYQPNRMFRRSGVGAHVFGGWSFGGERVAGGLNANGNFQLVNHWEGSFEVVPTARARSVSALRGGPALLVPAGVAANAGLNTDRRRSVSGRISARGFTDEAGRRSFSASPAIEIRPSPRLDLSIAPTATWNHDPAQYVGQRTVADTTYYLVGRLRQATASLVTRLNFTITPQFSLQFYGEPFLSAGAYDAFREAGNPMAPTLEERFRRLGEAEIRACGNVYGVRAQQDGCAEDVGFAYRFGNPDFNVLRFNSNAVLRWEYRPGSALFVVWNQRRQDLRSDGTFILDRDLGRLAAAEGTNSLVVKLSYWFGL